jgi:hypothetical protein
MARHPGMVGCGKAGQWVPSASASTVLIGSLTLGDSAG